MKTEGMIDSYNILIIYIIFSIYILSDVMYEVFPRLFYCMKIRYCRKNILTLI